MQNHKFKIGEIVRFVRKNIPGRVAGGVFEITRAMPFDGIEVSYRIKAGQESHERAVREGEIEYAT
jgi:DNA-directed RNA polymerase subunit H (RpoH/RPB5)